MTKYQKETVEKLIPVSIVCDVCKKEYDCKADVMEAQEFQCIKIEGGFSSVFGDGSRLIADICQHCTKKLIGPYLKNIEEDNI
jgi:antitoxin CcdA